MGLIDLLTGDIVTEIIQISARMVDNAQPVRLSPSS